MPRQDETCFDALNSAIDAASDERGLDGVVVRAERMPGLSAEVVDSVRHQLAWRRRILHPDHAPPDEHQHLVENKRRALALGGAAPVHGDSDMSIARGTDGPPATFLFRMDADGGPVLPVGILDSRFFGPVPSTGSVAVGGIVAVDGRHCVASFAHVSAAHAIARRRSSRRGPSTTDGISRSCRGRLPCHRCRPSAARLSAATSACARATCP